MRLRALFLSGTLLFLIGCSEKALPDVSGARDALEDIIHLQDTDKEQPLERPSHLLGVFSVQFLSRHVSTFRSSLRGVRALLDLLRERDAENEDFPYVLLQELGNVLTVNISEILNRSDDRAKTLNLYVSSLEAITAEAERELQDQQGALEDALTKRKGEREKVRELEKTLRAAYKAEDYAQVGTLQSSISQANASLAEAQTEEDEKQDLVKAYKGLLEIAQSRRRAIEENREILIAGLKVIDVPGIESLEILEKGKKRSNGNRTGGNGSGLFDVGVPKDLGL